MTWVTLSWDVSSRQGVTLSWDNDTVSWDVSSWQGLMVSWDNDTASWDVCPCWGVTLSWDNDTVSWDVSSLKGVAVSWDVSSYLEKRYHDKGWHIVLGCVITTVSGTVWCMRSYECQIWRKELCLLWN